MRKSTSTYGLSCFMVPWKYPLEPSSVVNDQRDACDDSIKYLKAGPWNREPPANQQATKFWKPVAFDARTVVGSSFTQGNSFPSQSCPVTANGNYHPATPAVPDRSRREWNCGWGDPTRVTVRLPWRPELIPPQININSVRYVVGTHLPFVGLSFVFFGVRYS